MKTFIACILSVVIIGIYFSEIEPRLGIPLEVGQIRVNHVDDPFVEDNRIKIIDIKGKYVQYVHFDHHSGEFVREKYARSDRAAYIRRLYNEVLK